MATETTTPQTPGRPESRRPKSAATTPRHNGRWAGYRHLLLVRIIELKREPEVVFWVFIFPLLLAAGLGIAFRNKPADSASVVVIDGQGAQRTLAVLQSFGSSEKGASGAQRNPRVPARSWPGDIKRYFWCSSKR